MGDARHLGSEKSMAIKSSTDSSSSSFYSRLQTFFKENLNGKRKVACICVVAITIMIWLSYLTNFYGREHHAYDAPQSATSTVLRAGQPIPTVTPAAASVRLGLFVPFAPDDPKPHILVTGGCGFVGGFLIPRLKTRYPGSTIKVVDNLWRGTIDNLRDANGKGHIDLERDILVGDLKEKGVATVASRNADIVFHLADIVAGVSFVFSHQHFVFHENILINDNMVQAAKENKVRKFLYTGTACSFPADLQDSYNITAIPENKTYPANPESAYGWSKLMGEYELGLAQEPGVFDVGIVRFHNLYGDRISYGPNRSQALPSLARKAIMSPAEPLTLWGSGKQYRDFLHVEDAVEAMLAVLDRGMNQGAIQVGTGQPTTLYEAASVVTKLTSKILHKEIHFKLDRTKPEGDRGRVAELTRAKSILGWEAKVPFEVGMERMFQWILEDIRKKGAYDPISSTAGGDKNTIPVSSTMAATTTTTAAAAAAAAAAATTTSTTSTTTSSFIVPTFPKLTNGFVTAKLDLWEHSDTGYLGNQMFIFQSAIGAAVYNHKRAQFARDQLKMLNTTFDLSKMPDVFDVVDQQPPYPVVGVGMPPTLPPGNQNIGGYGQDFGFFTPLKMPLRDFYHIRPKYDQMAREIMPSPRCIAVHIRHFPADHLAAGHNVCPTGPQLRALLDHLWEPGRCLLIFGNDMTYSNSMLSGAKADCIKFPKEGKFYIRPGHNEVHTLNADILSRDFAALTLCEDIVQTCGTFGALAAFLHRGTGSVYHFKDPGIEKTSYTSLPGGKNWKTFSVTMTTAAAVTTKLHH